MAEISDKKCDWCKAFFAETGRHLRSCPYEMMARNKVVEPDPTPITFESMLPFLLDLRARLDLGRTEASSRHVIVVVQHDERFAGLLVDAVQETFVVDEALLQTPPDMDSTSSAQFIDAIIPLDGRMLSRLVVASLLPATGRMAA